MNKTYRNLNKWFVAAILVITMVFSVSIFKENPEDWFMREGWIDIGLIVFLTVVALPGNPFRKD